MSGLDGVKHRRPSLPVVAKLDQPKLGGASIRCQLVHEPSLFEALRSARDFCAEALVRLESADELQEDGVPRMTWVRARVWDAYTALSSAHVRLPEERREAQPEELSEEALSEVLRRVEDTVCQAIDADAAWRAAMERESKSSDLGEQSHVLTVDVMGDLWLAHEIASALSKSGG